jgi:tetratricopeptide (TPR) repeat protein
MKTQLKYITAFFALLICAGASAQTLTDAIRLLDNEQYEKAKIVFKQLVAKDGLNGDNFYYFGDLLLKTDDPDSAKVLFKNGVDINATNPMVHVGMARYYYYIGNSTEGQKEIVNAKALLQTLGGKKGANMDGPRQAIIYLAIAETEIMAATPNYDDAVNMTNMAEKQDPKNPNVFLIRGDVLYKKDPVNGTPAITSYLQAAKLDPHSCKANLRIGTIYFNGKNMPAAIGYFNIALKTDSTFAPAWRCKGEAEYMQQKFDSASYCYNHYLKLNNDCYSRYRYCAFLYKGNDYDNAITQGNLVLACDSSITVVYRILGRCYLEKKVPEPQRAVDMFNLFFVKQKIYGKPPILPDDYINLGKAYSKLNKDSLSIASYLKGMSLDSSRIDIYFEIGTSYYKLKKYDMAAAFYKKKIDRDPAHANISDWTAYGRSLLVQKDYVHADSAFKRVTVLDPKNTVGWLYRAKANAFIDPEFKSDSTRFFYEHFFDLAIVDKDKNKKDLVAAAKYLAGYHLVKKNYACSKAYFQFAYDLDPTQTDVKKELDTEKLFVGVTAADLGTCKLAPPGGK